MIEYLSNSYFLLALTFALFYGAKRLQDKTGMLFINPILLTIAAIILFLKCTDIPYEKYNEAGKFIEFWLKPAIVALGVPLYKQLNSIKKQFIPIIVSQLVGCVVGIVSVVLIAYFMDASKEVILSLAAKSVTTPIAMEVTSAVGGIPSLTAAVVICVGLFGAITGFRVLKMSHVKNPIAKGLSIGTASHAIGTSQAMELSDRYGAYASLGLTLNGLLTALLTPTVLELMGLI